MSFLLGLDNYGGLCSYFVHALDASQPATSLSHRLGLTLARLCEALAARMAKDRTNVPLLFLAWTRLRRLAVRFEALMADFRAGGFPRRGPFAARLKI